MAMSIAQLHAIAVRRRGDGEISALLWEIKRLHELIVQCNAAIAELDRYDTDPARGKRTLQLLKALGKEPAIVDSLAPSRVRDPSLPDSHPLRRRRPEREPVTGYAQRRLAHDKEETHDLTERAEKRRSRERR